MPVPANQRRVIAACASLALVLAAGAANLPPSAAEEHLAEESPPHEDHAIRGDRASQGEDSPHGDHATIHHRFEDAEAWARTFEDPERDRWQQPDSVVAALIIRDDLWVADLGAATGYFAVRFARALPAGFVFGVDIEPDMIFYLNDRARREALSNLVSVLAAPGDPHLPQPVDLVFICNTYHHIDGRIDYFRRLRDQLRDQARIAVVDYRPESPRGPRHKLAPEVVEREMREAGYRLTVRHDFLPEQYFLVFEANGS